MQKIFDAANNIEANLLKGLLEQEGIEVSISGEYLQGAMGELPVMGLIYLWVDEADGPRAMRIIHDWERGGYAIGDEWVQG